MYEKLSEEYRPVVNEMLANKNCVGISCSLCPFSAAERDCSVRSRDGNRPTSIPRSENLMTDCEEYIRKLDNAIINDRINAQKSPVFSYQKDYILCTRKMVEALAKRVEELENNKAIYGPIGSSWKMTCIHCGYEFDPSPDPNNMCICPKCGKNTVPDIT